MKYLLLIISILVPPLGIPSGLLGLCHNFRHWKICVFCIALGIASIAYCYYPKGDPDIIRYIEFIDSLGGISLSQAFLNSVKGESNTYVFTFFCWIAARIHDPHIIPAISTFFVYYLGMFVTCQIGEDNGIKKYTVIAYILFIILSLNLYSIINNVRNVFAFTVTSYAVFRDVYLKKRNLSTLILYVFPVFIHQSAILIILLRLSFSFATKIRFVMMFLIGFINYIASALNKMLQNINSSNIVFILVKTFVSKADLYFNDTSSRWGLFIQDAVTYKIERYINICFALFICAMILYIFRLEKTGKIGKDKSFCKMRAIREYSFTLCLLTISCAGMLTPEYWRFYTVTVLFSAIVFFELSRYASKEVRFFKNVIFLITPIECMICIRRIVFSDLPTLLLGPFISSPIVIAIKAMLVR